MESQDIDGALVENVIQIKNLKVEPQDKAEQLKQVKEENKWQNKLVKQLG